MTSVRAGDEVLEVAAPTRADADVLVGRLAHCDCLVVERGHDEWAVRLRTWDHDRRSLREALSTVEDWLGATGSRETTVGVGERTFTLAAEAGP